MALHIRSEEADRLARQVSSVTGESITVAVTTSLRERMQRINRADKANRVDIKKVQQLIDEFAALPILDDRSADEILGYDENGLPT